MLETSFRRAAPCRRLRCGGLRMLLPLVLLATAGRLDEKMGGTIHLALGASYPKVGGTNVSSLHWDLIKDLREEGRIELDGKVVQENGEWLI